MTDLLLDVNVAVDIATKRQPFFSISRDAVAACQAEGGRIWLYAGSVQTLEYVARNELLNRNRHREQSITSGQERDLAHRLLQRFCR